MEKKKSSDTDETLMKSEPAANPQPDKKEPETAPDALPEPADAESTQDVSESLETAPLSFSKNVTVQAPTVISKDPPAKPEVDPVILVTLRCHVGAVRERNEDSCLVFTSDTGGHFKMMPFGLYIVADGMGGHANGHIASKTASRMVAHQIINKIYTPLLDENTANQPIQEVMASAVRAANTAIYQLDDSDSGTTLTTALLLGRRLHVAHVGDSRIYLWSDDTLEMLTEDHSLVHRLQEVGQLSPEEANIFQYRHVLLRALGQTEEVEADTFMRLLPRQGRLILCSDGLCGLVPDEMISEILQRGEPVEKTADLFLQAALDAGGYDNITVIVVDFSF